MHIVPFSLEKQLSEIGQEIDSAVLRVIHSGNYIGGKEVEKFEEAFGNLIKVRNVIGCNSGTDALILALRALDIGPGDEVLTTSFSFFATAEAISNVGAKPVFIDVNPNNYLLDINLLEEAITPASKAILPVHLFGCPVDMTELVSFAKYHKLKIIEDCAQAVGSEWDGRPVGSIGDIGCFSFFPTKNLGAAGDAGALTTNDEKLAKRIRELAIHGMPQRYFHTELGYNSRLDSIQAAILNVKLNFLPKWITQRGKLAKRYSNLLKGIVDLELPSSYKDEHHIHSWNQYVIRIKKTPQNLYIEKDKLSQELKNTYAKLPDSSSRDLLKYSLQKKGVNTIIYYPIPIHLQPTYINHDLCILPNTEELCSQVLSLPIYPELEMKEIEYVADVIRKLLLNNEIENNT